MFFTISIYNYTITLCLNQIYIHTAGMLFRNDKEFIIETLKHIVKASEILACFLRINTGNCSFKFSITVY